MGGNPRGQVWLCALLATSFPRCDVGNLETPQKHRQRIPDHEVAWSALVAKPVNKKEREKIPEAQAAVDKEWAKLRDILCWDESKVQNWRDVAKAAKKMDKKSTWAESLISVLKRALSYPKISGDTRDASFIKVTMSPTNMEKPLYSANCRARLPVWRRPKPQTRTACSRGMIPNYPMLNRPTPKAR